jgi:hypothetical protein
VTAPTAMTEEERDKAIADAHAVWMERGLFAAFASLPRGFVRREGDQERIIGRPWPPAPPEPGLWSRLSSAGKVAVAVAYLAALVALFLWAGRMPLTNAVGILIISGMAATWIGRMTPATLLWNRGTILIVLAVAALLILRLATGGPLDPDAADAH